MTQENGIEASVVDGGLLLTLAAHISGMAVASIIADNIGAGAYDLSGGEVTTQIVEERFITSANLELNKKGAL